MAIFMGFGLGTVLVFVFAVIIGGFLMWIAAKIARVEKSGFGRAMVAAIGAAFVSFIVTFAFHFIPLMGNALGFVLGLVLSVFVIKGAFDTGFGKALLVWVFYVIAQLLAVLFATMIAASSLLCFL